MTMHPNGAQQPQDLLLAADPNIIIRQLAELKMHLELELMTRDNIIEKLYARVQELELQVKVNEPLVDKSA